MTILLCRWALLLSALWLLPVLLLRAQPYDDGGLRDFLTPPEDCPAPCFMGLRPGVTMVAEAAAIRDQNTWVRRGYDDPLYFRTPLQMSWLWSAEAPAWLDPQNPAVVVLDRDRVGTVSIKTRILRAQMQLAFGRPDKVRVELSQNLVYQYQAWYRDLGMVVRAASACSSVIATYYLPVTLSFQAEAPDFTAGLRPPIMRCR